MKKYGERKRIDFKPEILCLLHEARETMGIAKDKVQFQCYNRGNPSAYETLANPGTYFISFLNDWRCSHWCKFVAYHELGHVKAGELITDQWKEIKDYEEAKPQKIASNLGAITVTGFGGFAAACSIESSISSYCSVVGLRKPMNIEKPLLAIGVVAACSVLAYKFINYDFIDLKQREKNAAKRRKKLRFAQEHASNCFAMDALVSIGDTLTIYKAMCEFYGFVKRKERIASRHPPALEEYQHLKSFLNKKHNLNFDENHLTLSRNGVKIH